MRNEKRAHLEAEHQNKMESVKGDVARLTSLLEQTLQTRSVEALIVQTITTLHPTTMAPSQLMQPYYLIVLPIFT
jgi:hypothetical protein